MKLSQKLSPQQREALLKEKTRLQKTVGALEGHHKSHGTMCKRMEKLRGEHDELEIKSAAGDRKAAVEIQGLLHQKMRLQATIDAANANVYDDVSSLRTAVNDAQQLVGNIAARDIQDQLEDEIEEALAPHFSQPANARAIARQTDSMRSLGQFFNAPIGETSAALLPLADRYLSAIDNLLEGKDVWSCAPALAKQAA